MGEHSVLQITLLPYEESQGNRDGFMFFYVFGVSKGNFYIAIKSGFSCINICKVPWEVLKTEAFGLGFQHLPRDLANVNALKNHVRSLLLH